MSIDRRLDAARTVRALVPAALRLAAVAAALALAGCAQPTLPCPAAKILREAASVTSFAPGQPPARETVQYVGSISDAKLSCSYDPNTQERLTVVLGVQIAAERPPASKVAAAELRYFVAIVNLKGEVLAKREFPLQLAFPPGGTTVSKVEEIHEFIPLKYPENGGSLQIWTGFQLNDAELQYNRAHLGG